MALDPKTSQHSTSGLEDLVEVQLSDFQKLGPQFVRWVTDYLSGLRTRRVLPDLTPGNVRSQLPATGPELAEPLETIFRDFEKIIVPATTHWNHPRFFAFFGSSSSAPAILAELLAATLNSNAMLWRTAPAATELEQVVLDWLRQWLGLPGDFFGIMHDTASTGTLHALAAARFAKNPQVNETGMTPGLVVYASEQAHSSVEKAALVLGFGRQFIRKIGVDEHFRMRPDLLEEAIQKDLSSGLSPCCVVATIGTTSTTSIDPVVEIVRVAQRYGLWVHVDAAYAGAAAIVPEYRWILNGVSEADSFVTNPHKWLFSPVDASVLYTRHPSVFQQAFSLVPAYLQNRDAQAGAVNWMEYSIALGRRFRALKLWFLFRYFGREGLAAIIKNHIQWAQQLKELISVNPDFEIVAPVPLSVICFRYRGSDEENQVLLETVNQSGYTFLSHTRLNDRLVLRFSIGCMYTTWQDVLDTWRFIEQQAHNLKDRIHAVNLS